MMIFDAIDCTVPILTGWLQMLIAGSGAGSYRGRSLEEMPSPHHHGHHDSSNNGLSAIREIKLSDTSKYTPVIVVTANPRIICPT